MPVDLTLELGSSGRLHLLCATVPRLGIQPRPMYDRLWQILSKR